MTSVLLRGHGVFPVGKLREEIAQRAREICDEEDWPGGRAAGHWLRAVAQIGRHNR